MIVATMSISSGHIMIFLMGLMSAGGSSSLKYLCLDSLEYVLCVNSMKDVITIAVLKVYMSY